MNTQHWLFLDIMARGAARLQRSETRGAASLRCTVRQRGHLSKVGLLEGR